MPTMDPSPRVYRFGAFVLDVPRRTLRKGRAAVHLTAKPFDVLALLVENAGRVVTKRELMDAVWADTFVVEDNLAQAILKIRRALGDDTDQPQFVLTIPRVGYRFSVPGGLVDAGSLEAGCPAMPAPAEPHRREIPRHPRWGWWAAASGILLTAAVTILWLAAGAARVRSNQATASWPEPIQVPLSPASATKPVFEADGRHFLYVGYRKEQPGVGDIYRAALDAPYSERITTGMDPRGDHPVLTPDGRGVVFARWRSGDDGTRWPDLWEAPLRGGRARVVVEQASGAGFSPDGASIAYTKHLAGSKPLWAAPRATPSRYREIAPTGFTPRWSPDGASIAFTTSDPEGGPGDLWIVSGDLATRRCLTTERLQVHGLTWTRDGRHIVFGARGAGAFRVWRVAVDGGSPVAMTAGVGSSSSPTLAPDGRTLLFSHVQPSRNLVFAPAVGSTDLTEVTHGAYHAWPALSPDASRIASVIQTPGYDDRLYVTDIATGDARRASSHAARHPVWLDSERLAYLGPHSEGGTDVRVADLSAGADWTWLRLEDSASWLAVSPDGRRVAAVLSAPNGRQRIIVRDPDGRRDDILADGGEYEHLRWVPGRDALSWSGPAKSAGPQSDGIWMVELGGAGVTRLVTDGYGPAWQEDGLGVYYSRIGPHAGLWRFDLETAAAVRMLPWAEVDDFDVRHGRLVFARIGSATRIFRVQLF